MGGDTNGDGSASSPAPGDWSNGGAGSWASIWFGDPSSAGILRHVTVRYGHDALYCRDDQTTLTLSDTTIEKNLSGIQSQFAGLSLTRVQIKDNVNGGVSVGGGLTSLVVQDSTFARNGGGGLSVNALVQASLTVTGNTFQGNGGTQLSLAGGGLAGNLVTGNVFSGSASAAVRLNAAMLPAFGSGNTGPSALDRAVVLSGMIPADAALHPENVYVLQGQVQVLSGVTLTVEPGTVVKGSGSWLGVQGLLRAEGTAQAPIYFTSYRDDSVGGDTNGDGSASSPAPGDWSNGGQVPGPASGSAIPRARASCAM